MPFNRFIFTSVIVLVIVASFSAFKIFSIFHSNIFQGKAIDSLPSPTGARIAETRNIGVDEYDDFRLFIVGRNAESGELVYDEGLRLRRIDSVGFIWLDEHHLLIASAHADDILDKPPQVGDVAIGYSTFPTTDPAMTRDQAALLVSRRDVLAHYLSEADDGFGLLGLGCSLYVEAQAAPETEKIKIRLSAHKNYKAKAWSGGRLVEKPEKNGASLLFYSTGGSGPVSFITAIALDDVGIVEGGLATDSWERNRRPVPVPARGFAPNWQIMWSIGEHALQRAVDKFRSGQFEIRLGYWFDNKEIVYRNSRVSDARPLEEFVHCVRKNAIFPDLR